MQKIVTLNLNTSNIGGIQTYLKMFYDHIKKKKIYLENFELNKKISFYKILKIFYNCLSAKCIFVTHISILNLFFLTIFKSKIYFFFYGIEIWKPRSKLAKYILNNFRFKKYITCSNYSKKYLLKNVKFVRPEIEVIYPYSKFEILKASKEQKKIKNKKFYNILSISRLEGEVTKGIWLLLKSLKKIKLKNIYIDIVGSGEQKANMEKYVKKNNIYNVTFHGFVKNLYPLYKNSDLNLYLTDQTGLGCSVVDSIYFNKPCLISKKSASVEVFDGIKKYSYKTKNDQDIRGMIKILKELAKSQKNRTLIYKSQYFKKFSKKNFEKSFDKIL